MSIPLPVIVFEAECAETVIGESLHVLGSISELGEWQLERSTALITSTKEFPLWRSRLFQLKSTPPDSVIQFKLLIKSDARQDGPPTWEQCANRIFRCPQQGQLARVTAVFGKNNQVSVTITEAAVPNALDGYPDEGNRPRILVTSPPRQDASPLFGVGEKGFQKESIKFSSPRVLRDLINLQSKNSLPAAALKIMAEHSKSRSLRQKFLLVKSILTTPLDDDDLSVDEWIQILLSIAFCALYVSWVATGAIPCGEDGGHHRPNQAAVAGQEILTFYELLRYRVARRYSGTHRWEVDMFKYFSSLITPCLPSCASQFTCSVPLTRIRDIAHRNDICEDLKREIKSRLQNKLHRCAGPEDLQTCKEFIHRFQSNPSAYPNDFMHQFNLFYQELREFFNAAELTERLQSLQTNASNPCRSNAVSWFLSNKFAFDNSQSSDWQPLCDSLLSMMRCTTHLRMAVVDELEANAFRESSAVFFGSDPSHGQSLHIVDVQAEKLFFTLTSRIVNEIEKISQNGFTKLPNESRSSVLTYLLSSILEALRNFACSDFARHYSLRLAQEVRQELDSQHQDDELLLIHCASISRRVLRLCEVFSDFVSAILPPSQTAEFSTALGVSDETGRIVGEGLIRASLPFQASRCASLLLRVSEVEGLGRSPYVTLSASDDATGLGIATETIESVETLEHLARAGGNPTEELPVILLVHNATGDEELEGLASRLSTKLSRPIRLAGILLAHELPTMSHLGVRARQQGVAFVALSNPLKKWTDVIADFEGKRMSLMTGEPKIVTGDVTTNSVPRPSRARGSPATGTLDAKSPQAFLRCGAEIIEQECGAKAAQCQRLHELASELNIVAPKSIALTKYALPIALEWPENSNIKTKINDCIAQLQHQAISSENEEDICHELTSLILSMEKNAERSALYANQIWSYLVEDATPIGETAVMVRSSSNVEDLEGLSAAGLYDSYPARLSWELNKINFDGVWTAIKGVWASLYTCRAVKARRCANVDSECWMGVLIQLIVPAKWSFVVHTRCPAGMSGTENDLYAELAQGLGEALAGGGGELGGGRPTRLLVNRETGDVRVQCICDFWAKYDLDEETGQCSKFYTALQSRDCLRTFWSSVGEKLLTLIKLETIHDSCPQDVEGCFVTDSDHETCGEMTVVQTRPQPTAL